MKQVLLFSLLTACSLLMARGLEAQSLRMITDVYPASTANDLTVWSRTVFDSKIFFAGNDGGSAKLYTMDASGANGFLPQLTLTPGASLNHKLHNAGNYLVFWGDDGKKGAEPWSSDGTAGGSVMLANLDKKDGSQLFHSIVSIGSQTYFGCFESYSTLPLKSDLGLYETDGTPQGTNEIFDDLYVNKLIGLNGQLVIDGSDNTSVGRELWLYDGSTVTPIGVLSPGSVAGDDDFPYAQWYSRHVYKRHEPVAAANCAFFNTWSDGEGNELWCTDGNALRQITGIGNGTYSTYPVQMTVMDGTLYFVGLDAMHGAELWSFPLGDPMNAGTASIVQDLTGDATRSEPCWLTVYNGELYFSAYTETTGRELFRYDGSSITLVADINPGPASSNPKYAPDEVSPFWFEMWEDDPSGLSLTVFNGKLFFAADDGMNGIELWSYDGTSANLEWDVHAGAGSSDPRFLTVLNGKLYFTAYTPQYGRAWYEFDPGGSSVNEPPVATASTTSISGLTVVFSSSGSYDSDGTIVSYSWDFGDGTGSSTQANPVYTYGTAGTYTATLTVTDNGSATGTDVVTITVSTPQSGTMYIASQSVTRVYLPGNKIAAEDLVVIREYPGGQPVEGAVVTASYYSATTGTTSGTTNASGEVTLTSSWDRNPNGSWCFDITDVQKSGYTYDESKNSVATVACEASPKRGAMHPASCLLYENYPNPFRHSTSIAFRLSMEGRIRVIVTDLLGREIARPADGIFRKGTHTLMFDATSLPSGMYLYRLETEAETLQRHMVLLR